MYLLAKTEVGALIVGIAFNRLSKILPVKKVRETKRIIAFWHPNPSWEQHIVIVPKTPIQSLADIKPKHYTFISEALLTAGEIAKDLGWEEKRWSVVTHGGKGQTVKQLHFHLNCGKLT